SAEGLFVVTSLAPGNYRVEAEAQGFQTRAAEHVKLDAQQSRRILLALPVGGVSQEIDVVSKAPLLEESPSVASTVTRDQVDSLPLNSRDFNQLVLLAGGAVDNINSGNGRDFGAVAVNGNRAFSNDYLIDGTP